jgi:Ni/Fe-hydrogenase 1 B-type cytochrome subunit
MAAATATIAEARHPISTIGPTVSVYVWQYPLRLVHWGLVISIGVLGFTGYYIHSPFIVGQVNRPFLMGWFRFVHEAFGMLFIALFLLRLYLFFKGNRWVRWRAFLPLHKQQWVEMGQMIKFYLFMRPHPVSKIGHNPLAALSYLVLYAMVFVEIVTGLVMYNWLRHSSIFGFFVGWIPRVVSMPNIRLIHFFLMFMFIAFGVLHVHLSMLVSREEKKGLMDSIFIGYKVIPQKEWEEEQAADKP